MTRTELANTGALSHHNTLAPEEQAFDEPDVVGGLDVHCWHSIHLQEGMRVVSSMVQRECAGRPSAPGAAIGVAS